MSIKRKENESLEDFKLRRSNDNCKTKHALKPVLFWDSYNNGTYENEDLREYKQYKKAFSSNRQFKKFMKQQAKGI